MKVGGWPNRGERNESRGPIASIALEVALHVGDGGGEPLDVGLGRVDGEARPQRAPDAESLHERLGAVVPGADGEAPSCGWIPSTLKATTAPLISGFRGPYTVTSAIAASASMHWAVIACSWA